MSLTAYFEKLIARVESSEEVSNQGKDDNGFYKPTKTLVLRHLNLLRDLHQKPRAREMVRASWQEIVKELPSEWLVLDADEKKELKKILDNNEG